MTKYEITYNILINSGVELHKEGIHKGLPIIRVSEGRPEYFVIQVGANRFLQLHPEKFKVKHMLDHIRKTPVYMISYSHGNKWSNEMIGMAVERPALDTYKDLKKIFKYMKGRKNV